MSLAFQWYYDGALIPGATSRTYQFTPGTDNLALFECHVVADYGGDSAAALTRARLPADTVTTDGSGMNIVTIDGTLDTLVVLGE
jgi:hypothetical protein